MIDLAEFGLIDDLTPPVKAATVNVGRAYGLRQYQADAMSSILDGFKDEEVKRQLACLATGAGKTILFSAMATDEVSKGGKVLILAHTDELLEQAIDKLARSTGLKAAKEKAGQYAGRWDKVVVGSVQTLQRTRLQSWPKKHFSLIIVDECFPSSTQVDGRNISTFQKGDSVSCYDHRNETIVKRKITHVFKRPVSALIRVLLSDGRSITCTPSHPIYTQRGYQPAETLKSTDVVYEQARMLSVRSHATQARAIQQESAMRDILRVVQTEEKGGEAGENYSTMQGVWRPCILRWQEAFFHLSGCCEIRPSLLFAGVHRRRNEELQARRKFASLQQDSRGRANEEEQSHAESGSKGADALKTDRPNVSGERRERSLHEAAGCPDVRARVGDRCDGTANYDCRSERNTAFASDLLQSGHRGPGVETSHRSGRKDPSAQEVEILGPEEALGLRGVRVDRVEILEPGCGRGFEQVCPDGFVYNLEVEEHSNYFAEGILVHNCHRSISQSYQNILLHFEAKVLGVTATADRGDKRALGDFYQRIAFDYGLLKAVRDGWLVRPIVKTMPVKIDLVGVKSKGTTDGNDFDRMEVAHRLAPFLDAIALAIKNEAGTRKLILFLPSVETAILMSAAMNKVGITCDYVSGECEDRAEKIAKYKDGRLQAICNMALLTEGFDHDSIDTLVILRPTKIRSLYAQMVGRGTRPLNSVVPALAAARDAAARLAIVAASAKPHVTILDFLWLYERHDLIRPASLISSDPRIVAEMAGKDGDLLENEKQAERDLLKKLEQEVRKNANRKAKVVDPLTVATELGDVELADYEPETARDALPPTPDQLRLLAQQGIKAEAVKCRGQASLLLDRIMTRHRNGLATVRQLHFFARLGVDASQMSKEEAYKRQMEQIQKWKKRDAEKKAAKLAIEQPFLL